MLVLHATFHFCKRHRCKAGGRNTIHVHTWRVVPDGIDGEELDDCESVPSDPDEGGVKVLATKGKSSKVDATTAMRRAAELRQKLTGVASA